ncbi:hypothetical protein AAE478_008230 [Parahypoxylon ruwenzoriense]
MAKYNKLAGKHVLVIGGSNGIGRGVVEACLESGVGCVTLSGSSAKSAAAAVAAVQAAYPDARSRVAGLGCDLSRDTVEQDLDELFTRAIEQAGQEIDHVVLTAGDPLTLVEGGVDGLSIDMIHKAAHMRFAMPALLGKVTGRRLGRDNEHSLTLSTGGIADQPAPGWSVIAFLAAGLVGLTRNLALDLKPLRVNIVEPGFVNTGLWEASGLTAEQRTDTVTMWERKAPTGKVGAVEDVAEAYVYLMKDRNATGEVLKTRGGANLLS